MILSFLNAFWLTAIIVILSFGTISHAEAQNVNVAVATNFTDAIKKIVIDFQKDTGHQVKVSHGSSGKLYAQIMHGANYDVFLSADTEKPAQLVKNGRAVSKSQFTYAQGKLALWSTSIPLHDTDIKSLLLKTDKRTHIAIANPKLAPYGLAAVETLKNLNVFEPIKTKIVKGENIGQTYQFIHSGNAQLGFVAFSQLVKTGHKNYKLIDEYMYSPISQDAVLLTNGQNNAAATAFMQFLKNQKSASTILTSGYTLP